MLGQAHTPRRRLLPFVAIAAVVLVLPAVGVANPSHSTASLQAQNAALGAKKRAAVLDLYALDRRLAGAQSHLAALHARSETLRAQRASLARQVAIARRGSRLSEAQLAQRLRLLYEQGNVEPLEIVFGAKSLDEALNGIDNLSRVSGQAEDVLVELKKARTRLGGAAKALATQQAALAAATREAQATAASLASAKAARSSYISSLAAKRRLNDAEIAALLVQARAAQVRSEKLSRTFTSEAAPAPAPAALESAATAPAPASATGGRTITVSATGYSLPGHTATGLPVGWGVAAVDPSVIPLGTHMTIPGYGEAVAADTGGAVVGSTIDLWFPTLAQANAWGRRSVTITLH